MQKNVTIILALEVRPLIMGYVKRDVPSAPKLHAKQREEGRLVEMR